MTKALHKIRLINPCQEKWLGMEESFAGRFCSKCEKEVIDFTKFSNSELISYFINNGIKEGCGRFLSSQLETIKIPIDIQIFQKKTPKWKKFLILFLVFFGRDLFNTEVVFGQSIANDSTRNATVCDSILLSEPFEIKDSLKSSEAESPALCVDTMELNKLQQSLSIKDILVLDTLKFDLNDSTRFICGGFGLFPENEIAIPAFEIIEILDSTFTKKTNTVISMEPSISKNGIVQEDTSMQNNPTKRKDSKRKMPLEAILVVNNAKRKRRK